MNHHGVSNMKVRKNSAGKVEYVVDSPHNCRINPQTGMRITAPKAHLAGVTAAVVTAFAPTGSTSRDTFNNCGTGITPRGTLLTREENCASYFHMPKGSNAPEAKITHSHKRYNLPTAPLAATATSGQGQGWHTVSDSDNRFTRWDISAKGASAKDDFRNEPFSFGCVVGIHPLSNAQPAKRVAMGRFAHEAAVCGKPVVGKPPALYMGDDSRNEYIYKSVTAANWDEKDIGGGMAAGVKYLTEGKLYVAEFNADSTGQWLELTIDDPTIKNDTGYSFANQADVWMNARHAADAVGATKMDRPE